MESPGSPAASASYGSTPRSSRAPSLSPAQLASHSMGAVDARCIVSPNMRAAGFIPLPHSPHHQPSHLAGPSTALPSAVPTPIDPPRFPPIVFINPTNVASTPMWEYQRTLEYGLPSGKSAATGQGLGGPSKHASRPAVHPMPRMGEKHSDDSVTSLASDSTAFGSSSSSLFLGGESAHSSMTSVASSTVQSPDSGKSLSQRMHGLGLGEPHVDGYPFPVTPPRSRVDLHDAVQPLRQPAPLLPSPAIGSSPDSGPMRHVSSPASVSPRSSSASESPATSSSGSRPAVSRRGTEPHALSITELCFNSPSAWLADPTILPHFMSTPAMRTDASRGRSRAVSTSRMVAGGRGAALSDAGSSVESKGSAGVEEEPVQVVKAEEVVVEAKEVVAAVEMERTATLKPVEEEEEDEIAKEKRREKHRGREKDKGKGKERYRHKTKSNKSHSSSSPTSTASSPQRDGKGKERVRTKTKEAKSTKEKARQTSPYTFATFFPPRDHRATPAHPHTLGAPDALRDREREREAGQFAKDQVLARRERDRRLAREDHHDERDRSSQHKVSVFLTGCDDPAPWFGRARPSAVVSCMTSSPAYRAVCPACPVNRC